MEYCGCIGTVVMEVLKNLKGPVPLTTIVSKVAVQLGCQEKDLINIITETINGGVRFGFIQRRRERFAFVPFNFIAFPENESMGNIFVSHKTKSLNNVEKNKPINVEKTVQTLYKSPKFNISLPQCKQASKNNLSLTNFKPFNDCKKKANLSIQSSPILKPKYSQRWDVQTSSKCSQALSPKTTTINKKRRRI